MRFRQGPVGFSADVEAMFHAFYVPDDQKDFIRFFWWKNNNPQDKLVQYRAKVHIFGNKSSPALANVGLRFAVNSSPCSKQVKDLVHQNFYVDDVCGVAKSKEQAIQIIRDTRETLQKFNIRLHKISSNSSKVVEDFPQSERANNNPIVNFKNAGSQQTLGIQWNTTSDLFVVQTNAPDRPFTKRGVLATINSTFDPLGFLSPIILYGRIIQRKLIPSKRDNPELASLDWDDVLPDDQFDEWTEWKSTLRSANGTMTVPRSYYPSDFINVDRQELHSFSDASNQATGYIIYLKSINEDGRIHISFVTANSKVVPKLATSIPRLELCAALDCSIASRQVAKDLNLEPNSVFLYSDSKVVLGYLTNSSRRFSRYVTRRVNIILNCFSRDQWKYVDTDTNPADIASRPQTHTSLTNSCWFRGPSFLRQKSNYSTEISNLENVILPEEEPIVSSLKTSSSESVVSSVCERTNSLNKLVRIMQIVYNFINKTRELAQLSKGIKLARQSKVSTDSTLQCIIHLSQQDSFTDLMKHIQSPATFKKSSHKLVSLSPFLDSNGLIRVGGRLHNLCASNDVKHPLLLSDTHPVTRLVAHHYHQRVRHQGRHITLSAIRSAGYFILSGSGTVKRLINSCVTCRKLRGPQLQQKMSDLPQDRLTESPPFTYCGMDVFGPFLICEGRNTRKNTSERKIWGLLFTCLVSRAVHIEPLPSMDTPTFKNALRRFFSIRGVCRLIRSDQGSNFIGARNQDSSTISLSDLKSEMKHYECQWDLNPPKASHFGGSWERKIGSIRRILEAISLDLGNRKLNRDEIHTFFQESAAIVNNTPLWEVSSDPNNPFPLTPANLLTLKERPNPPPLETYKKEDIMAYGPRRYRRVQFLSDQFWYRWRHEYLHHLQPRRKWQTTSRNAKIGDIVLMKDKSIKRNLWPMARIIDTKVSSDGHVRSVTLAVPSKTNLPRTFCRPISDIVTILDANETSR